MKEPFSHFFRFTQTGMSELNELSQQCVFRPLDLPRETSTLIFEHTCYVKMQINFRGSLGQRGMQFIVLTFTLQSSFIPLSRAEASISTASVGPQMTCSHLTSCGSDDSEQDLHLTVTTETLNRISKKSNNCLPAAGMHTESKTD